MIQVKKETLYAGMLKGLLTTFDLAKIIIPVSIVVTILGKSGALEFLADFAAPLMRVFGLSGKAALALFSGYFINLYAAIGVILTLSLTLKELMIIGVMLMLSHSLFMELAISKKAGCSLFYVLLVRLIPSLLVGILGGWLF
ncbi:MAG: hypothetical protein GX020_05795 [Firmicutes bacterium]|nr:hypothetical protein [Bacillota bacterium]